MEIIGPIANYSQLVVTLVLEVARSKMQKRRPIVLLLLSGTLLISPAIAQQPQPVRIVGIGATTCEKFVQEAKTNPPTQRNYLAWMQGYMSGIMIGRPPGADEGIDLTPEAFPLSEQLTFIRDYCLNAPSHPFADAVESLYKKLRGLKAI